MIAPRASQVDWVKILGIISPLLPLALIGFLFMAGMLETPEQKSRRVSEIVLKALNAHASIPGHPVMVERALNMSSDIGDIKTDVGDVRIVVKENTATLARIEVLILKNDKSEEHDGMVEP